MTDNTRRRGLSLIVLGILGALFFWLTDPRYGWLAPGPGENLVDRAHEALVSTVVGVAGSLIIAGIGLWLASRRSA